MKALTTGLVLAALLSPLGARADYFQLFEPDGRNFVALARVEVAGQTVQSDRYGRISVRLAPGQYEAHVVTGGTVRNVVLRADGGDRLKTVRLR
jgi:hypothetical protein